MAGFQCTALDWMEQGYTYNVFLLLFYCTNLAVQDVNLMNNIPHESLILISNVNVAIRIPRL